MKIKEFLYNNEKDETIALAYAKVSEIAKALGVKLKPEKDFTERMSYGYDATRRGRYAAYRTGDKLRDIHSIKITVEISSSPPWNAPSQQSINLFLSRELTDPNVSDVSSLLPILEYCDSVKIYVKMNWGQVWRRQAKKKKTKTIDDLAGVLAGATVKK